MKLHKQDINADSQILESLQAGYHEVDVCDALDLLTPSRFDLIAKYLYIKFRDLFIDSDFAYDLYLEHISALNGFVESDEFHKVGKEEFLQSFDDIIDSIKIDGFDGDQVVSISDGDIVDGAHRLAASIYYKHKVKALKVDNLKQPNFNYEFFESRGLSRLYLDAMALEYIKLKDNAHLILFCEGAGVQNYNELQRLMSEHGEIVYQKKVYLKNDGPTHLVKQIYKDESWIGNSRDGFSGAKNKAHWCFKSQTPIRVIVFESTNNIAEMKEKLQSLYQIKRHSTYMSTNKSKTLEIAGMLLNENSLHWMNNSMIRQFNKFDKLLSYYKNIFSHNVYNKEKFCIDGRAILSLYGVEDIQRLCFVHHGDEHINTGIEDVYDHNESTNFYEINRDEIIYNPRYHIMVDSFKFISLKTIKDMKKNRSKKRDLNDIRLINAVVKTRSYQIPLKERLQNFNQLSYWKGKLEFLWFKIRYWIIFIKKEFLF